MINLIGAGLLGLSLIEVLLHMLNFALLITGMSFLLYKPVKKFMAKREAEYRAADEANKKTLEQTELMKLECENMLIDARSQSAKISEEAAETAKQRRDEILEKARISADKLMAKTKSEIAEEKQKARESMAFSATELALDIATKMLERDARPSDNDPIIDAIISEWGKDAAGE